MNNTTPGDRHEPPKDLNNNMLIQTMILFAFSGAFYYVIQFLYNEVRKRTTCSISIQSSDDVYKMVMTFLT